MRLLVFGSRNLTARHLQVMRAYLTLDRLAVDGWWQVGDESWGTAAARRNAEMVALRPDRALCVHENLDASRGSIITADCLKRAGIPFRYVRVSSAGAVLSVEER